MWSKAGIVPCVIGLTEADARKARFILVPIFLASKLATRH
jgi:hypothetical protein